MMRRVLIGVLLLLSGLVTSARGESLEQDKQEILAFSAKVVSIDCDFVQRKESSLLVAPAVSSGHLTYRKPGYLEWDYVSPNPMTFVADGDQVSIKRNGQTETLTGNPGRMMKEMSRMIIGNMDGSVLTNEKLFRTEYAREGESLVVTLYPRKTHLQKMWSKLVLYYDRQTMAATRFEMVEAAGDLMVITFTNVQYGF